MRNSQGSGQAKRDSRHQAVLGPLAHEGLTLGSLFPGRSMMRSWPLLSGVAWIMVLPVSVVNKVQPPGFPGAAWPMAARLVIVFCPAVVMKFHRLCALLPDFWYALLC